MTKKDSRLKLELGHLDESGLVFITESKPPVLEIGNGIPTYLNTTKLIIVVPKGLEVEVRERGKSK